MCSSTHPADDLVVGAAAEADTWEDGDDVASKEGAVLEIEGSVEMVATEEEEDERPLDVVADCDRMERDRLVEELCRVVEPFVAMY